MENDETSHDHSCELSGSRVDSELSGSREEIELSNRNENCYEINGGALDVDLSGSLSLHSSSGPIKSSVLGRECLIHSYRRWK